MRLSRYKFLAALLIGLLAAQGCVRDPAGVEYKTPASAGTGIYVLNEGLFGRDNSSLTLYDRRTGEVVHGFFQKMNPGLRLGDTANSMTVYGGQAFIVMNGSNTIEIMDLQTARSLGRIRLDGNPSPREAVILSDTLGYVTALYSDEVIRFHPAKMTVTGRMKVGPAPEGMAVAHNYLFVANSGLGDIRASEAGAGTVSVIDLLSEQERLRLPVLPNCTRVVRGPDGLVYVAGTGSYTKTVPTGIAVIDPVRLAVIDTIRIEDHPGDFVLARNGFGYVLTGSAVVQFNWQTRTVTDARFIPRDRVDARGWLYALALDEARGELLVANARNFTTNGEVVVFDLNGDMKFRFETRLNPGTIVLFP